MYFYDRQMEPIKKCYSFTPHSIFTLCSKDGSTNAKSFTIYSIDGSFIFILCSRDVKPKKVI